MTGSSSLRNNKKRKRQGDNKVLVVCSPGYARYFGHETPLKSDELFSSDSNQTNSKASKVVPSTSITTNPNVMGSHEVKKRLGSTLKTQVETKKQSKQAPSTFLSKLNAKLEGGRFRYINEVLYTADGKSAFEMFQEDPTLFDVYHEGYRSQVEKWPENPLDIFISYLKTKPKEWQVGDFGCGEARLAQSVPQNVFSFDLVSRNEFITACDISKVPLKDNSLDVAIFCLSLMGTNFIEFLKEAKRTLKPQGVLKIAEVKSRFTSIPSFLEALHKLGFKRISKDDSNKMFILFEFVNTSQKGDISNVYLKPCKYKKR